MASFLPFNCPICGKLLIADRDQCSKCKYVTGYVIGGNYLPAWLKREFKERARQEAKRSAFHLKQYKEQQERAEAIRKELELKKQEADKRWLERQKLEAKKRYQRSLLQRMYEDTYRTNIGYEFADRELTHRMKDTLHMIDEMTLPISYEECMFL